MAKESSSSDKGRQFKEAKPSGLVIGAAREFVRMQLALKNKLHVSKEALAHLVNLPKNSGVILISNHADEMDPRICLELSRLSGKQFISMCNREAFDELSGIAGWALQHLGHFSVERGAHDSHAKQYAIDVVKGGKHVLVIFPEGEIFYLNEEIQSFHSGAVEICMLAILQKRQIDPQWQAFIVPMAIKYHHRGPIKKALDLRIKKMELRLALSPSEKDSFSSRLRQIQKTLLAQEDLSHDVRIDLEKDLFEQIITTENTILDRVKERHKEINVTPSHEIDQSWQLSAAIKKEMEEIKKNETDDSKHSSRVDKASEKKLQEELIDLKEVAHLSSWRPDYYEGDISYDRISEAVLKLERELYRVKRPRQLTRRNVFVNISKPIDISTFLKDYENDAHAFRHSFTRELQEKIQAMVDDLVARHAPHIKS